MLHWTEYVFLVWHIVELAETKVVFILSYTEGNSEYKEYFFPPKRVPAQLNANFLVYLSCFPGGLSLLKHDANIVVFSFGPMHETKTLFFNHVLVNSTLTFLFWFLLISATLLLVLLQPFCP